MKRNTTDELTKLFRNNFEEEVTFTEMMPPSGSYREYIRLKSNHYSAMGTWNEDEKENRAFIEFSKTFRQYGVNVPQIYQFLPEKHIYLQQDLGDTTLFGFLSEVRSVEGFSEKIVDVYRDVVSKLPDIQITAGRKIDYQYCYPRAAFDRQSMMWDLSYFKYYFLKLAKIGFDEQALEDDFNSFCDYLLKAESDFFMFRDFQSRNILLYNDEPWFIDYQGGRRGPLQYDLASLLYDSKADIPEAVREQLIDHYLDHLEKIYPVDRAEFKQYFYGYVLIRMMQAMGAYGFRGFYEKKEHFLKSIPYALENLSVVMQKIAMPVQLNELFKVLSSLPKSEVLKKFMHREDELTVTITSFSYKKGFPVDHSGNGGGYVFDCRAIRNPGRYDQYKQLTGKDQPVIDFFLENSEMEDFLAPVFTLVDHSVEKYLERKFTHLSVAFGCTGGQHRSVYSAERMAEHLREKYHIKIILQHREQENR